MFLFGKKRKAKKEAEKRRRLEELKREAELKNKQAVKEEPVKEEPVKEEPVHEEPTKEEPAHEEVEKEDVEEKEEKKKPRKLSYHVTKHPKGGWQIKKAKAERALKRFNTQREAIEYAKELEKSGASFVIHKADGTTRKKKY